MSADTTARRLWKNRGFNLLWSCYGLSSLGDAFANIALPLLVLQATGSLLHMGSVTGVIGAAGLTSGLLGGPIVDRADPRRIMIGCNLACAALYGSVPVVWAFAGPQVWLIYAVCAVGTLFNHLFQLANVAATATVVDRDQLTAAVGRQQGTVALTFVAGFMIAGMVSEHLGPAVAVGANGALLFVSSVILLFSRLGTTRGVEHREPEAGDLRDMLAGLRFLRGDPVLRWVALIDGGCILAATAALDLLIFRLKEDLGQDDGTVGVIFAVASVGSVAGALVASAVRRRWGFAIGFLGASFLKGTTLAAIGIAPSVIAISALAVGFSFGQTLGAINANSFRQETTPGRLQGRVTAAYWTVTTALGPIGVAIAMLIAKHTGASAVLMGMGLAASALSLLGIFSPIRGVDGLRTAA